MMKVEGCLSLRRFLYGVLCPVLFLAGCDASTSTTSGSKGPSPSAAGGADNSIEAYRKTLPPVPEALKPLAAELEQLGKQMARPSDAPPMVPLPGKLPYKISDDGKMVAIDLRYTPVEDEFLKKITSVPGLEDVRLAGTKVTDAALEILGVVSTLKQLDVMHTQVTPEAVSKFRESHPQCEVRGSNPK